jgi:hypothetical protein
MLQAQVMAQRIRDYLMKIDTKLISHELRKCNNYMTESCDRDHMAQEYSD